MSGIDPNGGGALVVPGGGASLPTASAAGELPVSDGAGSAYTATSAGDVLALGMVAALAGEPAGTTLISDGAGDIATTSADVSAMLAAADAAAALAAIGAVPTSRTVAGAALSGDITATTLRAALWPSTAISLASATGWSTTTAGGTTSVIDTGTERAVLTVAAATATFTLASVARTTLPALGRYSIQARIAAWTGVAATDTEQMLVRMTDSGGTLSDLWIYGTEAVSLTAGATVPGGAVTVAGLLAGQGWVRATVDGSQVIYACGVGTGGAPPTSWTTIGSRSTASAIMAPYTSLGVMIRRTSAQVTDLVAQIGDVSYRDLSP